MPVFSKFGLKTGPSVKNGKHIVIDGVADGFEAFCLARLVEEIGERGPVLYIVRDGQRIADLEQVLNFVSPDLPVLHLPAWDCLPYDRVSPGADASARRLAALAALASLKKTPHPAVIITTANAILQKLPPQAALSVTALSVSRLCVTLANMLCAVAFLIFMRRVQKNRCGSISLATRSKQSARSIRHRSAPQARARNSCFSL
jgi:transcription-repair coupling factor (superfamily II helicase)